MPSRDFPQATFPSKVGAPTVASKYSKGIKKKGHFVNLSSLTGISISWKEEPGENLF